MTVQIIPVADEKAPVFTHKGMLKNMFIRPFIIALPLALIMWAIAKFQDFFTWYIVLLFVVFAVNAWLIKAKMVVTKVRNVIQPIHDYYKQQAIAQGFQVDYESPGILIDDTAKKIVFTIDPESKRQYTVCDYADVQAWQLYQKDIIKKQDYKVNLNTGRVTGGDRKVMTANSVTVFLNYPPQPRYGFWVSHEQEGETWSARLNALING